MTTTPTALRPGNVVWARRRQATARVARAMWADPQGRAGVIVLVLAILLALFAPLLVGPDAFNIVKASGKPFAGPSWAMPIGADKYGRSLLPQLIYGSRVTLLVGFCAGAIAMVIGTILGLTSGHFGGWIDTLIMRFDDWMLVVPFLPLVIVLTTILGAGVDKVIIVLGVTSWAGTTRILRAQVLSIKARPYMERARALGASNTHQMVKHILPNSMPLILANTTLTIAGAILSESALQFLGVGDPFSISWGTMLNDALTNNAVSLGAWTWLVAPGVAIVLVVLAFNWCGNALEKVLNPRLNGR